MEWPTIIGGIVALLTAVVLPLALRKKKRESGQKTEELLNHLQKMGLRATRLEDDSPAAKAGINRSWGQKTEGIIQLGGNIDYIRITSVSSQYGTNYFPGYMVSVPGGVARKKSRTRLIQRRSPAIWGRVVALQWRGDRYLAQQLNLDYQLKDRLVNINPDELKGGIQILPAAKHHYTIIKTAYRLPSSELFEVIDYLAGQIKSG